MYAGFTYTGWLYAASSWNLTGEVVAEPYFNPLAMLPEEQRKHRRKAHQALPLHQAMPPLHQAPEPDFWTEGNANKV